MMFFKYHSYFNRYECMDGDYTIKYDIRRFPPVHSDAITSVSPIQNGLCLSASKDKSVILFDFHIGNTVEKWKHDKEVTKVYILIYLVCWY